MAIVAVVAAVIGLFSQTRPDFFRWHAERHIAFQLLLGFAWGFVQQYVLQSFINRRAQMIWGAGMASTLLTAAIFAGLHFPIPG